MMIGSMLAAVREAGDLVKQYKDTIDEATCHASTEVSALSAQEYLRQQQQQLLQQQ